MFSKIAIILVAGLFIMGVAPAPAAEVSDFPLTVQDDITRKECGDCHMVFPPNRLTIGGWTKIMDDLANHFGEDASLPPKGAKHIKVYLLSKAMDAKDRVPVKMTLKQWAKKGIIDPIRITETPNWTRHHTTKKYKLMSKDVKYMNGSNFIICHKNAERGMYEEFPGLYGLD